MRLAFPRLTVFAVALLLAAAARAAPLQRFVPTFPAPAVPAQPIPAYGYEPYDSANPRGFVHPDDTGFGRYHNPSKPHLHRSPALSYRYFRGY